MSDRAAIVAGVRSPFCKAGTALKDLNADDLGAFVVKELLERSGLEPDGVDELVFGNVLQPPHATNLARVLAVKGGLSEKVPAVTVNRNCASGMEAAAVCFDRIRLDEGKVYIAGGVESMSNFPILFKKKMREFLQALPKAKSWKQKLSLLATFRLGFLAPDIPKIADPLCSLTMGETAEVLAREFLVSREEQEAFALESQKRASHAQKEGLFGEEITPVPLPPKFDKMQLEDVGPRDDQTLEALQKLKPVFDRISGTVTAGTSSQVTDGAVALLIMRESEAEKKGLAPLGYIIDHAAAALDPSRMGLGPAYAIHKLLKRTKQKLNDFSLIEINEAFAAQVLAVRKALASKEFCAREFGLAEPIGKIDLERLNVNGGAVALGHPLGASGARLILTLLLELRRRGERLGLASLCVGGGQGQAIILEAAK